MPKVACLTVLVPLIALAGCESAPSTSNPGPPPPHGGELIAIPGGAGFLEVVKKVGEGSTGTQAAFYFYKDPGTPVSPAPTGGSLSIGQRKVELKSEGDALVTPPGQDLFKGGDVEGTLTVDLGGKTTSIPLGIR